MTDWSDRLDDSLFRAEEWVEGLGSSLRAYFRRPAENDDDRLRRHWSSLDDNPSFAPIRSRLATVENRGYLADAIRHVVRMRVKQVRVGTWALNGSLVLAIGGAAATLIGTNAWLDRGLKDGEHLPATLAAIVLWLGITATVDAASGAFSSGRKGFVTVGGMAVTWASGAAAIANGADGFAGFVIIGALAAANVTLVGDVLASLVTHVVVDRIRTSSLAADPVAHIAVSLGDVVNQSPAEPRWEWTARSCACHLENAANVLENYLPSSLAPFDEDSTTEEWLTGELRHRAAGLRVLKRQLYVRGAGDVEAVSKQCGDLLVAALDGHWAEFPCADPSAPARGLSRLGRALDTLRAFIVSIVPLGVVVAADRLSASFTGSAATWAWMIAAGWAVVGVLVLVDPRVGERLELTRRLLTMLPGIGGEVGRGEHPRQG